MPDRALNDDGTVNLDNDPDEPTPAQRQAAINACTLCDQHGYHGTTVCDHTDHRPAAQRGIAAIRAQMGWTQPTTPDHP